MFPVPSFLQSSLFFLSSDPIFRMMQIALIMIGGIAIFLVFYATRDIILRTKSFWYQFLCIVVVAVLPIVGFFLYLLIRPSRTIKERGLEEMLRKIVDEKSPQDLSMQRDPGIL